jgi:hypothetical protein
MLRVARSFAPRGVNAMMTSPAGDASVHGA